MVSQLVARFLALVTLVTAGAVSGQTASAVKFERHNILLTLDITSHVALVQDSGTVQVNKGWNLFFVNKSAELRALAIAGKPMASIAVLPGDTAILPTELRGHLPALEQKEGTKLVLFNAPVSGSVSFKTTLRETFNESVENVQFS